MKKLLLFSLFVAFQFCFSQAVSISQFATGFSSPVGIEHPANDTRLFIVQQGGLIRILNSNGTINATPFINLSSIISTGGERGLLGLAFHPNYATNRLFFVNYTNTSGNTVIAKYAVNATNPNIAQTTGTILMTITQPYANHNGGCLRFGPDGYLYIGMGDGGSAGDPENRAQNKLENLGKMLRIDVNNPALPLNYGIPPTNPYVGIAGNDEIWAIGLRNPWKFSFNRLNGDLWIADVGQNAIEEINKVVAPLPSGLNFGWKCYEGNSVYSTTGCPAASTLTAPFAQYTHSATGGCSITGGYVYTGTQYPNLVGKYIFADYCNDKIGVVDSAGNITYTSAFSGTNITTFGEDVNGEIYVAGSSNGIIYKTVDTLSRTSFEKSGFSIYPNPAKSEFFVKSTSNEVISNIQIFDLTGKLLLNQTIENSEKSVSTSGLKTGIYLLTATTINGNQANAKLIIE